MKRTKYISKNRFPLPQEEVAHTKTMNWLSDSRRSSIDAQAGTSAEMINVAGRDNTNGDRFDGECHEAGLNESCEGRGLDTR